MKIFFLTVVDYLKQLYNSSGDLDKVFILNTRSTGGRDWKTLTMVVYLRGQVGFITS